MRVDVLALQRFYASPLGETAQRAGSRRLATLWPYADGLDVLGVGYPTPYLDRYRAGARRVTVMMPAKQGVEPWPAEGRVLAALGDEARLPFMDAVFDRVLLVHALEECEAANVMLREIWRVMAPEGRLVVMAANRWSLWAQSDVSPLGHGRPYSRTQLSALLADSLFEPVVSARALYAPPWRWAASVGESFEQVGEVLWPNHGGFVLMEAVKRLYASTARSEGRVLLAKAPARSRPETTESLPRRNSRSKTEP